MAFVKVTKNKAYFKRFQTKYRRRREFKTDYSARKGMIMQDLNKYLTPKYRLVARITARKIITQIAYSTLEGDRIICQADSSELKNWGLTTGFTSYSAAYATGLLLSRRLLTNLKLDGIYKGVTKIDGADYDVSNSADLKKRPFTAILDIGIRRATIGNRVFGVMKGACDGGIHIPHSEKKFPGFIKEEGKKGIYNAEIHRNRIYGVHIDEYMELLASKSKDDFNDQFRLWDECLKKNGVQKVEDLYKKIFDEIRKSPLKKTAAKKAKVPVVYLDEQKTIIKVGKSQYKRDRKITLVERKARVAKKLAAAKKQVKA